MWLNFFLIAAVFLKIRVLRLALRESGNPLDMEGNGHVKVGSRQVWGRHRRDTESGKDTLSR